MSCRTDLESEFKVKRNGWISIRCLQKSQEKLTIFTMIYRTIRWTSEDKLIYKNKMPTKITGETDNIHYDL